MSCHSLSNARRPHSRIKSHCDALLGLRREPLEDPADGLTNTRLRGRDIDRRQHLRLRRPTPDKGLRRSIEHIEDERAFGVLVHHLQRWHCI